MTEDAATSDARRVGRVLVLLVLLRFALPLVLLHPTWQFHRDELLYFAMGDHLDWRMQFPPFLPAVAHLSSLVFGDAVWAARVPAALGGAAVTAVVLLLIRRLGGGAFALALAWTCSLAAPVFVRPSVLMHPVVFDQLWAVAAVAALVIAAVSGDARWWLAVGAGLGMGLLTKASAVMYGAVVFGVAVAHPRLRLHLRTRWPWLAALLAVAVGLPSLLGQVRYGWPFLDQLAILERTQFAHTSPLGTLLGQVFMLGAASLVAVLGLVGSVRASAPALRTALQVAALFAVGLLLTVLLRGGKDYYAGPGYPVLIALGCLWVADTARRLTRTLAIVTIAVGAIALLPMGVPLLGKEAMARYAAALGQGTRSNMGQQLELPQDYSDMLGRHQQAEAVARVVATLTPEERNALIVSGGNYGQVGALATYRHRFLLPYPVSTDADFHAWGPGDRSGEILVIAAGADALDDLEQLYHDVHEVGRLEDGWRVPEERDVRIYLCRRLRRPLRELWPSLGPEWG